MITGLPAGSYLLRYRRCLTPAGDIVGSQAAGLGPGSLNAPATSSRGYVTGGHLTTLGGIAVRAQAIGQAAGMPARPAGAGTRLTAAQLRHHFSSHFSNERLGGIAGTVLGPHGRPIKGLCVDVYFSGGFFGSSLGADGRYNTGKVLGPGKYAVGFTTACGPPFDTASANWAPQWYRGKFRLSAANAVVVKADTNALRNQREHDPSQLAIPTKGAREARASRGPFAARP